MPNMRSEPFPETYRVLSIRSCILLLHPALLTKLSSYGIQGNLHSWLVDFLSCHSQRMALNSSLSSPLPIQREFLKVVFLAFCFFWFSSMISQIPWKILFISLLMTPPSA